mgnify:CR=1 FL=1
MTCVNHVLALGVGIEIGSDVSSHGVHSWLPIEDILLQVLESWRLVSEGGSWGGVYHIAAVAWSHSRSFVVWIGDDHSWVVSLSHVGNSWLVKGLGVSEVLVDGLSSDLIEDGSGVLSHIKY